MDLKLALKTNKEDQQPQKVTVQGFLNYRHFLSDLLRLAGKA